MGTREQPSIRAVIVDDDVSKQNMLGRALRASSARVVNVFGSPLELHDSLEAGEIDPTFVDAVFLDAQMEGDKNGGQRARMDLFRHSLVRSDKVVHDNGLEQQIASSDRLVIVGSSKEMELSIGLGSMAVMLGGPVLIDWDTNPLEVTQAVTTVRHLRGMDPHPRVIIPDQMMR